METKKCKKFSVLKILNEFPVDSKAKGGYRSICLECRSVTEKAYRVLNSEKLAIKSKLYYSENKQKFKDNRTSYESTVRGLWVNFKSHKTNGKHNFDIDEDTFSAWYVSQSRSCVYCGLELSDVIKVLKILKVNKHPKRMEIDRKDSNLGYVVDNIVLACTICNFHKGQFFNFDEFKDIAETYLKPKFHNLLNGNV